MVTKINLFVILIISSFGFSQNYGYLVETEVLDAFHANGGDLSINSDAGNVGSVNFFATQNNIGSVAFEFLHVPNNFTTISMIFNAEAIAIGSFPDCSSTLNFNTTIQNFNTNNNISFIGCNFALKVYPLHIEEPNASNSTLCLTDQLTLQRGYDWQYSYNGTTWFDFPSNLNTPVTTFVLSNLLGQTSESQVKFRTGYNGDYTNIVSYTIISCSPQLTSFTSTNTQCSYSSDGGFTVTFDRALNTGEELIMTLYKVESDGSEIITSGGQQSTTTLSTGNTYNWPLPQIAGNYLVKYQTKSGSTFSSLETSGQFTISKPPSITFSATKQNDVYCYGGSDGAIQLNASGGVGNFKYELNNNGVWIPFTATNTHTITGLSKGSKKIKVQDGNGCTQKE